MRLTSMSKRFNHASSLLTLFLGALVLLPLISYPLNSYASADLKAKGLPAPYRAEYLAKAFGMSADAYRSLERIDDKTYRLTNSLSLTVLGANIGSVIEHSDFQLADDYLRSIEYKYVQTGVSRTRESVVFDWQNQTASSQEDDESHVLEIRPEVLDKLSFTAQLSMDLAALGADYLQVGREFVYQIVDGDEIEEQRYAITSLETLDTPLGSLAAVKVDRLRSADSRRRTSFWLAVDKDFLLLRLEQVSGSGSATELVLKGFSLLDDTLVQ